VPGLASSFQIHFSSQEIHTPGEKPDVLVAMNPAALKVHLSDLKPGGTLIINKNAFTPKNLKLAGYETDPTEDDTLVDYYQSHFIEMSKLVTLACEGIDLSPKLVERTKNLCALGVLFWIYDRPLEPTIEWLKNKFKNKDEIIKANTNALNAGYNYGETAELFTTRYVVEKAKSQPPMKMLGHVSSSYYSPTNDHPIALAMIKDGTSRMGDEVEIPLMNGKIIKATVTDPIFYDKEGLRNNE